MQALAGVAYLVGQAFFDIEMHILQVQRPLELASTDFLQDFSEAALDCGHVLCVDDALRTEHARMGQRALNVELCQTLVEVHRGRIALDQFGHRLIEAARPTL